MPQKQSAVSESDGRNEPSDERISLRELLHVRPPWKEQNAGKLRWTFAIAALVNFVATVPFLVNSVLHHLFDVPAGLIEWAQDHDPTRPFILWTFLGYGVLWGCFFVAIAARPVERRAWIKVAIAEKLVTTIAVWTDFVVFDSIRWPLPVLVLFTDLSFVFVFAWALRAAGRLAVKPTPFDEAGAASLARIPAGSSPTARWFLRFSAVLTLTVALVVLVASLIEVRSASSMCRDWEQAGDQCTVLGTTQLWSLPPLVLWIWAGMEIVISATMLWASADVVRRRAVIPFGIFARLIPVVAVLVAQFSRNDEWNPSNGFTWWVIGIEGFAASCTWLARRWANASALTLGVDPARIEGPVVVR